MPRVFFAVDLDDPARQAAAALARGLREASGGDAVRWVRPASYHLTLRFLGDLEEDVVAGLGPAAGAALAGVAPFSLRLTGLDALPSSRRPRVIVLGAEPDAPLAALAARLEPVAAAVGLAPETRPFRGHLTLGRLRQGPGPVLDTAAVAGPVFRVDEVLLIESRLAPGGSIYTPLARLPLGNAAAVRSRSDSPCTRASQGDEHGQARTQH